GCRRRSRANSIPWLTSCWRTRETVRRPVPSAATICSSECSSPWPSSANRRMRAWVSLRAAAFPLDTICCNSARSSSVTVTRYLSIAVGLIWGFRHGATVKNQGTAFTCQMKMDGPLVARPEDAQLYLTEARTVAALDHPNIVPVYDVGSNEEYPVFIVSKYIE